MKACGSHDKAWKDGRQHDAQEFLRSILEAMQVGHSLLCLLYCIAVVGHGGPVYVDTDHALVENKVCAVLDVCKC